MEALKGAYTTLKAMNRVKDFDINGWVNDSYLRAAFKQSGLDYDAQKQALSNYDISGTDPVCKTPVDKPASAAQVWLDGGEIVPFSSAACAFAGIAQYTAKGQKIDVVYVMDHSLGIKLFADKAFYVALPASGGGRPEVTPFLQKADAERFAADRKGRVQGYQDVLATIVAGK
jgi:NitT/TauT family transport system substrate-binding protein